MEEVTERALFRNSQKEQERERRRIRDRQRRQSMTVEEREKHLARRRRNYQLRRQRAEISRLDPKIQSSIVNRSELLMLPSVENQEIVPVEEISVQCKGVSHVGSGPSIGNFNFGRLNSVGLDLPADVSAKLPKRSCLRHIKNLARSLHDPGDILVQHKAAACLIINGNIDSICSPEKGLRLNRVKQLARTLNSGMMQIETENHHNEISGFCVQVNCCTSIQGWLSVFMETGLYWRMPDHLPGNSCLTNSSISVLLTL